MSSEQQPLDNNSPHAESHLSHDENHLLNSLLPHSLAPSQMEEAWNRYQRIISQFLVRMGTESLRLESVARLPLVGSIDGMIARIALIPHMSNSALHVLVNHRWSEAAYRLSGECALMELSAAAGYRTFCFPELIKGLLKSGKMKERPVRRMIDTFDFLNAMMQKPMYDSTVLAHLERTQGLHKRYKVAGAFTQAQRDLFKYIALNMFYIGPAMRPDLSPQERYAICGLTVLVAQRMGHVIDGSVRDLEAFIKRYEAAEMFDRNDTGVLRRRAVEIAQASKAALDDIPIISAPRIHGYVPYQVKKILQID